MDKNSDTEEIKYVIVPRSGFDSVFRDRFSFDSSFPLYLNQHPIEGYKVNLNVSSPTMSTRINDKNVVSKELSHYDDDVDVCVVPVQPKLVYDSQFIKRKLFNRL